ncbi:hypothetical protein HPB50_002371 [Hyalomma asiaticum]|uniref:Uncharacterized protein n=1 Tax=Hyalomma asiaticum TaxID=266040 RepID=A0ACB7TDP3_HYAAI|nr:hypothetical protein HPB50_002371 [Hyalomma asiaticum]
MTTDKQAKSRIGLSAMSSFAKMDGMPPINGAAKPTLLLQGNTEGKASTKKTFTHKEMREQTERPSRNRL